MATMKRHHARGREETMFDVPPLVSTRSESRRSSTRLREGGMSDRASTEDAASWRRRNPGYAIAWRMDRRAVGTQAPEPLRMPAPLNQLPWDVAKDQFGVQGADFIAVMGALMVRSAKDQIWTYLPDPTRLPSALPLSSRKTSPDFGHTESRTESDATGVSPTGPAVGASASPRAAPARRLLASLAESGQQTPIVVVVSQATTNAIW